MRHFKKALLIAGSLLLVACSTNVSSVEPDCLPEESLYELVADYQERGKRYSHYYGGRSEHWLASYLVLEESDQCEILKVDLLDLRQLIIDFYVPERVARQLYLQTYSEEIQLSGGLDAYQQSIDSIIEADIARPFRYVSPAQEWALYELGVRLPDYRYVVSADPHLQSAYFKILDIDSPAFSAERINDIQLSNEHVRAEFILDGAVNILVARDSGLSKLDFIFSGPAEDYNPTVIARENQIPMSVFEEFEE